MQGKFLWAALGAASLTLCADTATAGRRSRCCVPQPTCCAPLPTCAAPLATTATAAQPGTATAPQAGNPQTYQSFSYEPGASSTPPAPAPTAAPAPTYAPSPRVQPRSNSLYDSVRGDRKARGF